jgi:hypothetical protein
MRTASALAAILLVGSALAGEQERMRLVQPQGTELVVLKLVRDNDLYAKFAGQVWVAGTVIGRWPAGATNMSEKEPEVLLIPDSSSIDALPYFVLREPPYFNQYKVRTITLLNEHEALKLAVGDRQMRRLLERRVNHVRATGRFLIEQYVVGVECDAPWAKAVLVNAELPEQIAKHQSVPEGC